MRHTLALLSTLSLSFSAWGQSPYINKVYEFRPAPGQFTNSLPQYEEGDTEESMRQKAEDCLADHAQVMISLGGFGGYVTFGFDHTIVNKPGHYDFTVLGNAFYSNSNPNPNTSAEGGSSEPGIVMVSRDNNGNGEPDDEWYELAGSEYTKEETRHNYTLTYFRPSEDHVATPDLQYKFLTDTTYVAWESGLGEHGYVAKNSFHRQNYYPNWIADNQMSFTGTLLANNAIDESGKGSYYVQYCYGYGYVDNHPNTDDRSKFNIEWAVNSDGTHVDLDGIDFVRVYTGINQYAGWLGETSTEVMDAWDLHILGGDTNDTYYTPVQPTVKREPKSPAESRLFDLSGRPVSHPTKHGIVIGKTTSGRIYLFINK